MTISYTARAGGNSVIDQEHRRCRWSSWLGMFSPWFGFGERACTLRRELAARSERELQDMGTCWSSIADEVSKPFWRP